jgi:hypothetical protein
LFGFRVNQELRILRVSALEYAPKSSSLVINGRTWNDLTIAPLKDELPPSINGLPLAFRKERKSPRPFEGRDLHQQKIWILAVRSPASQLTIAAPHLYKSEQMEAMAKTRVDL